MKTFEQYLRANIVVNNIDQAMRAQITSYGKVYFYIHPANASGETLDFVVEGNELRPLNPAAAPAPGKQTVSVYLDDGRVFEYDVAGDSKAREHSAAIIAGGYRHNDGTTFEHYPPQRILKVKVSGVVSTMYPDRVRGT